MFKTRYPIPGEPPGVLKPRAEPAAHPSVITLIEFDRTHLEERTIKNKDELLPYMDNQRVTWINIDGLGDIDVLKTLGSTFNLHPLALEDVLATGQRPKMEQYDGYLFITRQMLYLNRKSKCAANRSACFWARIFSLPFRRRRLRCLRTGACVRIRAANGSIRKQGADYRLRVARFHRRSLLSGARKRGRFDRPDRR